MNQHFISSLLNQLEIINRFGIIILIAGSSINTIIFFALLGDRKKIKFEKYLKHLIITFMYLFGFSILFNSTFFGLIPIWLLSLSYILCTLPNPRYKLSIIVILISISLSISCIVLEVIQYYFCFSGPMSIFMKELELIAYHFLLFYCIPIALSIIMLVVLINRKMKCAESDSIK